MINLLRAKAALIGTPFEDLAKAIRWHVGALGRARHPEMREAHLEDRRLPLVLKKLLKPNANGVDVGCHIGGFLSLLIKICPKGEHVAIEASPTKSAWLRSRFKSVAVHNVAISNIPGRATFEDNQRHSGYSRLINGGRREANNLYYDVEVTTLDEMFPSSNIEFLKLDIEGTELDALRGGFNLIARCRPIILFEVGSEYALEKMQISRRDLYDCLTAELGYEVFTFTDILFDKGPLEFGEFKKCGLWPFRAFNFIAKPGSARKHAGVGTG